MLKLINHLIGKSVYTKLKSSLDNMNGHDHKHDEDEKTEDKNEVNDEEAAIPKTDNIAQSDRVSFTASNEALIPNVIERGADNARTSVKTLYCLHGKSEVEKLDHCHYERKEGVDEHARRKLIIASALCVFFMVCEMVGGVLSNSLAIATDAAHLLSDFAGFMISLFAIWLAGRPSTQLMSFGWYRAEVIGAITSVCLIWVITGILVWLAINRLVKGDYEVDAKIMLITSGLAIVVNLVMGMQLHQGHGHGVGHGHSHGNENAHGHSHGNENGHGHSHGNENGHGHSHGNENAHGYENAHGHSHGNEKEHGRSNGGDAKNATNQHDYSKHGSNRLNTDNVNVNASDITLTPGHYNVGRGEEQSLGSEAVTVVHKTLQNFRLPLVPRQPPRDSVFSSRVTNMNLRAAYIHVIGDMVQSIGIFIAALIIYFRPSWAFFDPICTFLFSIIVLYTTIAIVKDALLVLMEATPSYLEYTEVVDTFMQIKGVEHVHNLHIWALSVNKIALSVHLAIAKGADSSQVLQEATTAVHLRYNFFETTIQIEEYTERMESCDQCMLPTQ